MRHYSVSSRLFSKSNAYSSIDMCRLPLINRLPRKSEPVEEKIPIEIFLRAESALLEYGSLQWMEWFARRLKYYKYAPEVRLTVPCPANWTLRCLSECSLIIMSVLSNDHRPTVDTTCAKIHLETQFRLAHSTTE